MNATSWHKSYLAHDQSVGENQPTRIGLQRRECKAEDLKVPSEAYAKEEADVDQHLFTLPAVEHNVDEHAGVDEKKYKDWKVEPKKFAHTTVKVTAPE